jgi:membrane protein implicated in regulation of membrane protease activity
MNNGKKEKEGKEMGEEKTEKPYPVKSLHDFLFELDREWSKFRNGTLLGLISSGFLFVVVLWLMLIIRRLDLGLGAFLFLVVAGVFLGYSIYAMYSQYRFFNKWERRIGLLLHLEEEILAGKLDEPMS